MERDGKFDTTQICIGVGVVDKEHRTCLASERRLSVFEFSVVIIVVAIIFLVTLRIFTDQRAIHAVSAILLGHLWKLQLYVDALVYLKRRSSGSIGSVVISSSVISDVIINVRGTPAYLAIGEGRRGTHPFGYATNYRMIKLATVRAFVGVFWRC